MLSRRNKYEVIKDDSSSSSSASGSSNDVVLDAGTADDNLPPVSLFYLLLGVLPSERWKVVLGFFSAMLNGLIMPVFSIIFGNMFNSFLSVGFDHIMDVISLWAGSFAVLGAISFVISFLQTSMFAIASERIANALRNRLFSALLAKDIDFYDKRNSGDLTSRLSTEMAAIQTGCSEKVGLFVQFFSQTVFGIGIALFYGWQMTLVLLSVSPLLMVSMAAMMTFMQRSARGTSNDFAAANTIASEVLSGYRTVLAFSQEQYESQRYADNLRPAKEGGSKRAYVNGAGMGLTMFFMFGTYALGFWYGGNLVQNREMNIGDELTVFFCIIMGAMGLGQAMAQVPDIVKGKAAAATVLQMIDEPSVIHKPTYTEGKQFNFQHSSGSVEFRDVHFRYPSRPEHPVLNGISFTADHGEIIALVGSSGGGKSTILQLLLRFYDPSQGSVFINNIDAKDYNLHSLRDALGLVSQEPILFSGTILQNIRYGRLDATEEEIHAAARAANAHNFIVGFEKGYDTLVGERGTQLSGGQKQRIAIARAILKNPKILLLDEATSALDAESERLVQDALNRLMKDRTTIVIAHRLSTIQDADRICVLHGGQIVEMGNHTSLMEKRGFYFRLIQKQQWSAEDFSRAAAKKKTRPSHLAVDADADDE